MNIEECIKKHLTNQSIIWFEKGEERKQLLDYKGYIFARGHSLAYSYALKHVLDLYNTKKGDT